jgi:hypothetical protein
MKRTTIITAFLLVLLTSCTQRGCQRFQKKTQFSERSYEVVVFSGGDTVYHDKFTGIVNGEEGTDGFYYFKRDTLIEISGDYVLKSR